MDIEIMNFHQKACKKKIGCVVIRYHELYLKCDLVYHAKHDKAWIRMPEVWVTKMKKLSYCFWPSKEISDNFQKEVLKKIFDIYNLDVEKIKNIHFQQISKRTRQDLKK